MSGRRRRRRGRGWSTRSSLDLKVAQRVAIEISKKLNAAILKINSEGPETQNSNFGFSAPGGPQSALYIAFGAHFFRKVEKKCSKVQYI